MDTLTTLQGICLVGEVKDLSNKISIWIYINNSTRDLLVVAEGFNKLDLYMDTLTTFQGICWLLVKALTNKISIWIN